MIGTSNVRSCPSRVTTIGTVCPALSRITSTIASQSATATPSTDSIVSPGSIPTSQAGVSWSPGWHSACWASVRSAAVVAGTAHSTTVWTVVVGPGRPMPMSPTASPRMPRTRLTTGPPNMTASRLGTLRA